MNSSYLENLIRECGAGMPNEPTLSADEQEMFDLARDLDAEMGTDF